MSVRAPHRLLASALAGLAVVVPLGVAAPAQAAAWRDVAKMCVVKDTRIRENSGMSRSTYARRVLFVHNDSGGGPQFFAIGTGCSTKAVFDVPGAPAKDWEDMASGPGHTLWFGDIGGSRSTVNVVVVNEPKTLKSKKLGFTSYELRYPDGDHNAEAMMVRPGSGRVFVITKASTGAGIYRAPETLDPDRPNQLTRVGDAPGQGLSGADYARSGKQFVLRGYEAAYLYTRLDREPKKIALPDAHTFGEAVAFDRRGALIFGAEGVNEWLWRIK